MSATLFADRFLQFEGEPGGCALDLASGQQVTLRPVRFEHGERLQAWLQQCARLMDLPAPRERSDVPALVDFGAAGLNQHFEALAPAPPSLAWPRKLQPPESVLGKVLQQLEEVLDTGVSGRPRLVEFRLPPAVPGPHALNLLARVSRLRGYVPVHPGRLQALGGNATLFSALQEVLRGRHAVVLDEACAGASTGRAAAALFVSLALDSDRPHVLLVLGREAGGYRGGAPALRTREEQAGYLVRLDAPTAPPLAQVERHPLWRGHDAAGPGGRPRSRVLLALESAGRGRHASAVRTLRETLAMAARREDFGVAGDVALMLGRVMLARGQVGEASGAFESARLYFDRAGMPTRSVLAAVFLGLAWTDAGRWLEAEAAIRAAVIAADSERNADAATFGALALARCLLWQERHAEALEALPPDTPGNGPADRVSEPHVASFAAAASPIARPRLDDRVVRPCLASRIALASGDVRAAGLAAAAARERASLGSGPAELALACTAMAAVYAALGDAAALRRQVDEGLRAARLAHAPLRALRLRAVLAAGLLRAGKASEARALVARLARLDRRGLPAVVRVAVDRVVDWPGPEVDRAGARAEATAAPARDLVEPVVEILGLCQAIEDDEALLQKVIATLRARLRAAVAACLGMSDRLVAAVTSDGRDPVPSEVGQRAADAALPISPAATLSGLEAAVPVQCGGHVIGALACRWAADVSPNWPASSALLQAAAAAVAPFLRAVLDRRAARPPAPEACADEIVGGSAALRTLREEIERAARAPFNVVIEGESGSGKELVARAVHRLGPRRHHRLCAINCAALTDDLLEAELFGHARGAFTGAIAERKGLFEEADGGTLVLDEVGELTPRAQAKLLRAIQEGEVRRLGENFSRPIDVRIIAASNRPLRSAAESGAFRRDLLYRLEVIRIVVPPLRERVDDIPRLAVHFWQQATARIASRATLAPATLAALAQYDWPGNVRELQNVMSALAVSAARRGSVGPDRLPAVIAGQVGQAQATTLEDARRAFEARFVRAALARAGGHRARAAEDLGLTRQGLAKLLARLGIDRQSGLAAGVAQGESSPHGTRG